MAQNTNLNQNLQGNTGWQDALRNVLPTILILGSAPLIAFFLTSFVFQSYQVDGPSMETTLQNNDRLIVWKLPKTWSKLTKHPYIPKHGDIIVFSESNLGVGQRQLIKRVIALPGDRVLIKNGTLTIFNNEHPKGFKPDTNLPFGKNSGVTAGNLDMIVPSKTVFVCGDNRGNSLDSRIFGPVDARYITGKLVLRLLPLNKAERF